MRKCREASNTAALSFLDGCHRDCWILWNHVRHRHQRLSLFLSRVQRFGRNARVSFFGPTEGGIRVGIATAESFSEPTGTLGGNAHGLLFRSYEGESKFVDALKRILGLAVQLDGFGREVYGEDGPGGPPVSRVGN